MEWNDCSALVENDDYNNALSKYDELGELNAWVEMRNIQKRLQEILHEKLPDQTYDINEIMKNPSSEYIIDQVQALTDEFGELIDALPGMSMDAKLRSAVWKKWKSKYVEVRKIKFSDLKKEDRYNVYMEAIDILHFAFNLTLITEDFEFKDVIFDFKKNNYNYMENIGEMADFFVILRNYHTLLVPFIFNDKNVELDAAIIEDIFKKIIKIFSVLGLSSREIFALYYSKNKENIKRFENKY